MGMPGNPGTGVVGVRVVEVDRRSRLGGHRDGAGRGALAAGGQAGKDQRGPGHPNVRPHPVNDMRTRDVA